jgi:hypothetical protein
MTRSCNEVRSRILLWICYSLFKGNIVLIQVRAIFS